jgi:hypothetical protein
MYVPQNTQLFGADLSNLTFYLTRLRQHEKRGIEFRLSILYVAGSFIRYSFEFTFSCILSSFISMFRLVWCPGQNKRIAPLSLLHGCRKRRLKD